MTSRYFHRPLWKAEKVDRVTDWVPGDYVSFVKEGRDLNRAYKIGTGGKLVTLERIQDGVEVWSVSVSTSTGSVLGAATNEQLSKVEQ